jgi:hypothetical protein
MHVWLLHGEFPTLLYPHVACISPFTTKQPQKDTGQDGHAPLSPPYDVYLLPWRKISPAMGRALTMPVIARQIVAASMLPSAGRLGPELLTPRLTTRRKPADGDFSFPLRGHGVTSTTPGNLGLGRRHPSQTRSLRPLLEKKPLCAHEHGARLQYSPPELEERSTANCRRHSEGGAAPHSGSGDTEGGV